MRLRVWHGPEDTSAMQGLASSCWPRGPHPGGIGWCAATDQLPGKIIIADDGGLAGWAGVAGGEAMLQADPGSPFVAEGLIKWVVAVAEAAELTITVFDGDETVRAAVTEAGFVPVPDAAPVVGMFRDVGTDSGTAGMASMAAGYRVRSVRPDESDARVEVHRRAWRPVTLPWPGEPPPAVTPEVTSRFTGVLYERVRATWLYDPAWDLVVEAPDGSLAACCIAWWDPALGCAEIEPLGVVPEHRRRGLAGALCQQVIEQVRAAGGERVFIDVAPRPDYPAPAQTYLAAGFDARVRGQTYCRAI